MTDCGTTVTEPDMGNDLDVGAKKAQVKTGFSNIIIIQMDKEVQEVWDTARKINCEWVNLIKKRVEFEPFEVEMLDFEEVKFEGDSVDCWMDLQVGRYPDSEEITSAVKIGEPLSMLVYAKDDAEMYDIHVKQCYAYSSEKYDNSDTVKLQLTDERGCVMKNKLLDGFYVSREPTKDGGSNIVAYGYLSAFKFPDVLDVFTTCEVEICKGVCNDKCQPEDIEGGRALAQPQEDDETTPPPFLEQPLGQPTSCEDEDIATGDPRCRKPKQLEIDCVNNPFDENCPPDCTLDPFNSNCPPNCDKYAGKDPRCPINCNQDPFNQRCPPDCTRYTGLDPRCPCSKLPLHPNCPPICDANRNTNDIVDPRCPPNCAVDPFSDQCPPDCKKFAGQDPRCPCSKYPLHLNCPKNCDTYRGKDVRCPCSEEPFHKNCPADCTLNAGLDERCPCSELPTHPNCPPDCKRYTGKDPRCSCEKNPFHRNCPSDCNLNAGKDPRCPCRKFPLHPNCLDCNRFRGRDPRCPCEEDPLHDNCPPNCDKYAGEDPRCPCSKYPLSPNCPPNCELYAGKDSRCPCNKYPFHKNCPPNCKIFTGQDPRCPCDKNPFHFNCPAQCDKFIGKDPRCPCTKDPFNPLCPPDCKQFKGRDPRCPPDCGQDPFNEACPPDCIKYLGKDPRCGPDCVQDPLNKECKPDCENNGLSDPRCEGDASLAQGVEPEDTTTTPKPKPQTPRAGRQNVDQHNHHHGHHDDHHHGGSSRYHAFHSFHYDPGDGRRNKRGKKRVGRSIDFVNNVHTEAAQKNTTGKAKLAKHIRVISPDDLPHFDGGSLDFEQYKGEPQGAICLPLVSFYSGLTTLLVALFISIFLLTVQCLRNKSKTKAKEVSPVRRLSTTTYEYQNYSCDQQPRLNSHFRYGPQ